MFLNVLYEERRRPKIINGKIKEPLYLLVVEIHGNEVGHSRFCHHVCEQLGSDAAPLSHLAVLAVGEVRHYPYDLFRRRRLGCVARYQHFHDGVVDRDGVSLFPRVTGLQDEHIFPTNRLNDLNLCFWIGAEFCGQDT